MEAMSLVGKLIVVGNRDGVVVGVQGHEEAGVFTIVSLHVRLSESNPAKDQPVVDVPFESGWRLRYPDATPVRSIEVLSPAAAVAEVTGGRS